MNTAYVKETGEYIYQFKSIEMNYILIKYTVLSVIKPLFTLYRNRRLFIFVLKIEKTI